MKSTNYSTISNRKAQAAFVLLCAVILAAGWFIGGPAAWARAEEKEAVCWVMMKPGDWVNLRMTPSKKSTEVGRLFSGDRFTTDGKVKDGFVHVLDAGDCDCWVYAGYVVFEEPVEVMENYIVCSNGRVACRRWMDGELVARHPWAVNGSEITVFYTSDGWACTNRGYMRLEYLEVDPQ